LASIFNTAGIPNLSASLNIEGYGGGQQKLMSLGLYFTFKDLK
jgi:hypothetical protein